MDQDRLGAILSEIQVGARDGRAWRERAETRLGQTAEALGNVAHALEEISREMKIHLGYAEKNFERLERRLEALEGLPRGQGGAVDVNISQGNQTVGAEPAASATKSMFPKAAAVGTGGGAVGWLLGGGWDQLSALIKKITG